MARTAVTPAQGVKNGGVAPTVTTINAGLVTAGVTIADANPEELIIRVANTDGAALDVYVRASTSQYPAWMSGQGDLSISVPATTGVIEIAALDSALYLQPDGSLSIDFATGFTGTLETTYRPYRP
jgi:hypothetical protein